MFCCLISTINAQLSALDFCSSTINIFSIYAKSFHGNEIISTHWYIGLDTHNNCTVRVVQILKYHFKCVFLFGVSFMSSALIKRVGSIRSHTHTVTADKRITQCIDTGWKRKMCTHCVCVQKVGLPANGKRYISQASGGQDSILHSMWKCEWKTKIGQTNPNVRLSTSINAIWC